MPASQIKTIAIITMVIDHVGLFFFPHYILPRVIGRLSFPLFAWLIANGAHHTHNIKKYLKRLFLLALISQVPFTIANQNIGAPLLYLNVVFTLFLGLLAIYYIKKTSSYLAWLSIAGICALIADIINSDYGAAGVLSVVAFYIFFTHKTVLTIAQMTILCIIPYIVLLCEKKYHTDLSFFYMDSIFESIGLLSLSLIFLYNNKEGPQQKYLFYIFYPIQYICIALMQYIVLNNTFVVNLLF
jgi:hypothetical protein